MRACFAGLVFEHMGFGCMAKLSEIEGVGENYACQLKSCGVRTRACLLEHGSTPIGRKQLAAKSGISTALLLRWIKRADLMRVRGIGGEFADLLECLGVGSVQELAQRNAAILYQLLEKSHEEKSLVSRLPSASLVHNWVEQAKNMKHLVSR